jgi:hypothetical protein
MIFIAEFRGEKILQKFRDDICFSQKFRENMCKKGGAINFVKYFV